MAHEAHKRTGLVAAVSALIPIALASTTTAQPRQKAPSGPATPASASASAATLAPVTPLPEPSASVAPVAPPLVAQAPEPPAGSSQQPAPVVSSSPPRPVFVAVPIGSREASKDQRTDHEKVLGRFGISWLGISEIPIANARPTGTANQPGLTPNDHVDLGRVSAPALGVRYWINNRIGVEPGIGFYYSGGSTTSELGSTTTQLDKQTVMAMLFHVGVPISIASAKHITLVVIPETNLGFARSDVKPVQQDNAPPDAVLSGLRFDIGARAGGEVHFGFMGIPELSLEASVGLLFSHQRASASAGNQSVTDVSNLVTTTSFANPWDIFRSVGTVAARYYF